MGLQLIGYSHALLGGRNFDIIMLNTSLTKTNILWRELLCSLSILLTQQAKTFANKGVGVKYLNSGFGANLGLLCVRLFDDMLLIIHRMRF